MIDFYNKFIDPAAKSRAKVSVFLHAQAGGDAVADSARDFLNKLSLDSAAMNEIQAVMTALNDNRSAAAKALTAHLVETDNVPAEAAATAVREWMNESESVSNSITPTVIKDVRDYKARLNASQGAFPVKDLSEYEDAEPKL